MQTVGPIGTNSPEEVSRYYTAHREVFLPFTNANPSMRYIFVQWLDYMGLIRTRCIPTREFANLLRNDGSIRISNGNLGTLQTDHMTSVCNPVGSICVEPDVTLRSLRPMQNLSTLPGGTASVMARFTDEAGIPLDLCPRAQLGEVVKSFRSKYDVDFLVGFEIEITFCKALAEETDVTTFVPLDTTHAWGTFTDQQYTTSFGLMLEIAATLQRIGVDVQQLHSEAGAGQYEFVLPPLPPVEAVDTLVQARQCIQQAAASRGLRATCHPQPFPGIGTAAHAHISFNRSRVSTSDGLKLDTLQMSFMSSVLAHLSALCAITMPQAVSYARVLDDAWTGGTWIAWGAENREVPLRKSAELRWEVRCLDGCANMYLALTAIFAAGLFGVRNDAKMLMKDCHSNPSQLSAADKQAMGIIKKLPTTINEAVQAAESDSELREAMPKGMLEHYLIMKKAEQTMLNKMEDNARRIWLMERY